MTQRITPETAARAPLRFTTARKFSSPPRHATGEIEALYASESIGVALIGTDMRFIRVNATLAEMNGQPAEAHAGRHVRDVVPDLEEVAQTLMDRIVTLRRSIGPIDIAGETPARPGVERVWSQTWSPVFDDSGTVVAASILTHEITETRAAEREIRAAALQTREVLDSVVSFVGRVAPNGTLIETNTRSVRATPCTRDELIGTPFWDCYWWSGSPAEQARLKQAIARAAAGETVRYDADIRVWTGSEDWPLTIDFQLVPRRDAEGRVVELIPSASDITARRQAEQSTRASLAQLHLALGAAGMGMITADADGRLRSANDAFLRLVGLDADAVSDGRVSIRSLLHPAFSQGREEVRTLLADGSFGPSVVVLRHADGHEVHTVCAASGPDAGSDHYVAFFLDQTRQHADAQHREFLVNELKHRVRNTLATVQAIASQTARQSGTLEAFMKSFSGRLNAIALGHDTLTGEARPTADMAELVERQLSPFASPGSGTLDLDGPPFGLDADTAHALGLVLHELATNAAKYGALSASGGTVEVAWAPETTAPAGPDAPPPRVRLIWSESGGPPARQPSRNGFGSRLIRSMVVDTLGGEVDLAYHQTGLVATITVPATSRRG